MQQLFEFVQQQQLLFLALLAILLVLVAIEWKLRSSGPKRVAPAVATNLINHEQAQIVDIRSAEAFQKGHIIGAQNIAQNTLNSAKDKLNLLKDKPVLLICEQGNLAPTSGSKLQQHGFAKVYCLDGGLNAWRDEHLPLTK